MAISILGFTSSNKVPIFAGETVYGAGAISAGSAPIKLLVIGLKATSGGTITLDGTPVQVLSSDQGDTLVGAGSEAARMIYAALRIPSVALYVACPTPAGGAVAASATITITSTPPHASTGEWRYRVGGVSVTGAIGLTDTQNAIATAIANTINGNAKLPVSALAAANIVTLTVKSAGIRGNQHILFQDTSGLPSTVTSVIAGGASVTGGGVFFVNGAGTESLTNLLTAVFPEEFGRIAFAQNDATNAAAIEAHVNAAAGALQNRLQHAITAVNGLLGAAQTLSQTTLNAERVQLLWMQYSETHPSELAAQMGSLRAVTEQSDPDASYDDIVLTGVAPQSQTADRPDYATKQSALSSGVTPLTTNASNDVLIVRSITSKSLTNSVPDYRTLDTSQAVVPDFCRRQAELIWYTNIKPNNPRVQDNPAQGQKEPPAGVLYPDLWEKTLKKLALDLQAGDSRYVAAGLPILINADTDALSPIAEYDPVAKHIVSVWPVEPAPANHSIGLSVRNITSA